MDMPAIQIKDLYKTFKLPREKHNGLKGLLVNFYRRNKGYEIQKVLKNVSFDIQQGEFFGIVGRNGSGKSTLLKLLAGIYAPDKGLVRVNGSLTPFIELGVGFNPELTGRENVFLNGALLGFNRKEMLAMYDDIVAFAELERFMDQKLKNYSSGMQVRLAFSIAIRAKSDILLIDEVLAVGDAVFQKKCFNYFRELKRMKKTVVFISHDPAALSEYCDRGILLDNGRIRSQGDIDVVVRDYIDLLNDAEEQQATDQGTPKPGQGRWGVGGVRETHTKLADASGKTKKVFTEKDKHIMVTATYRADVDIVEPVFGITILNAVGERIFTSNTMWSGMKTELLQAGEKISVRWEVPNVFNSEDYSVSPAVAGDGGLVMYDWHENAAFFKVRKELKSTAFVNLEHKITITDKGSAS